MQALHQPDTVQLEGSVGKAQQGRCQYPDCGAHAPGSAALQKEPLCSLHNSGTTQNALLHHTAVCGSCML